MKKPKKWARKHIGFLRFLKEKLIKILFRLYKNPPARTLLNKIESESIELHKIAVVKAGLKAYETGKGNPLQTDEMKKKRIYHSKQKLDQSYRVYLNGKDVRRYLST